MHTQKELGVTWDVDLYGELLKIGGGKERYVHIFLGFWACIYRIQR